MAGGYAGKILRVNLTRKSISTIDTVQYEEYGGGHGMGSAIFWDLVGNQLPFGALDPRNVVTIMASPFSGVFVPSATSRCEVQCLAPQGYPVEWYTRSNFGGRFAAHLKYAGWDGVVIEGAVGGEDDPVWINIINDKVTIESAKTLWGLDAYDTQEEIWRRVNPRARFGEWMHLGEKYTTQQPAVLCIGQAGENQVRMACLLHDAGCGAGQGGFGAVWGSKKLKAISVLGTGQITVSDPKALMDARLWYRAFQYDVDNPRLERNANATAFSPITNNPGNDNFVNMRFPFEPARAQACAGCPKACRQRLASGLSDGSSCGDTIWAMSVQGSRKEKELACDLMQTYGFNTQQLPSLLRYMSALYKRGILGRGKKIECDLPMDLFPKLEFFQAAAKKVAMREGIGDLLSQGCARVAETWGRLKEDTDSGLLALPNWGYAEHYDPRLEVEWSYGSILGERDINEHSINMAVQKMPSMMIAAGMEPVMTAEKLVEMMAGKVPPYSGDPYMFDYGEGPTGIYSDHRVKTIAWHRHYTRFWLQSLLFCDWVWPQFMTPNNPDKNNGATPDGETRFFSAVTGKKTTFVEGMETGRTIWNLDRSIWVLQGRHRDMEVLAGYVYKVPTKNPYYLPVYQNGKWTYDANVGRVLDKEKFEEWKTKFYDFEGWNNTNGWPKRNTLEQLGLKKVADQLQSKGKLG
jgi:aldehyde:ferredoxin oxidoreductase